MAGDQMTSRAIAILVLLFVSPVWLSAQGAKFSVESPASVHKAPSIGSPAIGQVQRGVVLEVTRDLGSWVKVPWPDAPDGVGYVHTSWGIRIAAVTPRTADESALTGKPTQHANAANLSSALPSGYVMPPAHVVGLGGQVGGSMVGAGMNARTWLHDRLGLQLEVSRTSLTGPIASQQLTATQFSPSLLYSLSNLMTDYVWVRPYLGAGPRVVRRTLGVGSQVGGKTVSQSSVGLQTFGGGEFTFASMPRFSVSADIRYGWIEDTQPDFELDGLGFSLSAHWYVK
jgi:hypothetical protein